MNLLRLGRERLLLFGALAALTLLLLDRLLLTPFLGAWRDRAEEIQRLRLATIQGTALVAQESRWRRWRDEMGPRLLPASPGEAESALLTRVDAWARDSGLTVGALRPRWKETADHLPLLELQVSGTGDMRSLVRFLHQLETSPLALAVEHVEIVPRTADGNGLTLDVRLSGLCRGTAGKGGALL